MRLAFLIRRPNHYRLLGPVVDRALARGWDVECWEADGELKGGRALERRDAPPAYRHGAPGIRRYVEASGPQHVLSEARPDVLVSLHRPKGMKPEGPTRWLGAQYTLDIAHLVDRLGATNFDAIGVHTKYWRDRAADALRFLVADAQQSGRPSPVVDDAAVAATLRERGTVVGFPEMDQFHGIDAEAVRAGLRLAPGRPVVVYCPYPVRSNSRTFWTRNIYSPFRGHWLAPTLASRLPGGETFVDLAGWARQRLAVRRQAGHRYARDVAAGRDDRGVVRAVRAFCDANGAALVVKARAKDPVPGYLSAAADRVLYDRSDYPATILELMSVASLCVHFFSTVAYEAAYAGVPSVCVTADADDLGFAPMLREWFLNTQPGSSFAFPGVVYPLSVGEVVEDLPRRRLADFPLEPAARAQYLDKFVGRDDGKASDRLLDLAAALMEERESRR
jgi:hypothetical protein